MLGGYSRTVDVVVRNDAREPEEVTVTVPDRCYVRDIKEVLAEQINRPEILQADLGKLIPDGSYFPLKDTTSMGTRRLFIIKGIPLHPPPPPKPPSTVEDMDEFDPDELIESPRSIRACNLEGINAEDLTYVPYEDYSEAHPVDGRIAEMWHDFFEALRQDHLEAVRATRKLLIAQEEEAGSSFASTAYGSGSYSLETVASGNAGGWSGSLEQCKYPRVHEFFLEQNEMSKEAHLFKNAHQPFRKGLHDRYSSSARRQQEDLEPIVAGDTAKDAADKLYNSIVELKQTPNSEKFVEEQRLKTEAEGIVQRHENSIKLHREQAEARRLMDKRIETAEVQIAIKDGEMEYTRWLRQGLEKRAFECRPPPTNEEDENRWPEGRTVWPWRDERQAAFRKELFFGGGQHSPEAMKLNEHTLRVGGGHKLLRYINMDAAKQRAANWAKRREVVHENQLNYEHWRNDEQERMLLADQAIQERVHQHRNLHGLRVAREWTKRRIRWTQNTNGVGRNVAAWNAATLAKHQAADERIETQKVLKKKWIEYRRELQGLKRMFAELAVLREQSKAGARRDSISEELKRMSVEHRRALNLTSYPRNEPTSPALSSSRKMDGTLLSLSSSASVPTSPSVSGVQFRRAKKKQPRFDFPRMANAGSLALTDAGSMKAPSLRSSASAPSFSGTLLAA